ncbi:MAG: hypothetical protein V3T22_12650 [Planctomycetota bacterium]
MLLPRSSLTLVLVLAQVLGGACAPAGVPPDAAVAPFSLQGDRRPRPITDLLGDSWGEDNGRERKRWIAGMHVAAPGTDWRASERSNGARERERRARLVASDTPGTADAGAWQELGSRNQAGHTRCAALGPVRSDGSRWLYVGSANGGLWRSDLQGRGWVPLSGQLFGGVDEILALRPLAAGDPDVLLYRRGREFFRSRDDGRRWERPLGLERLVAVHRTLALQDEARTILLLGDVEDTREDGTAPRTVLLASIDQGASFAPRWTAATGHGNGDLWVPRKGSAARSDVYLVHSGLVFHSRDAGLTFGLPTEVDLRATAARLTGSEAGAPTLYLALLIDGRWQLHRSDDGGGGFGRVGFLTDFWGSLAAFPADTEALIYGGVECHRSSDGGRTFTTVNAWGQYYADPKHRLHADVRGIQVFPDLAHPGRDLCFISTDGGTYLSDDGGTTVTNLCLEGLGVGQIYSTLTSSVDPDLILAGTQDQGFQRGRRQEPLALGPSTPFEQLLSGDYGYLTSSDGTHGLVYCAYPGFVLVQEGERNPNLLYPWIDFPEGSAHAWLPPLVADPADPEAFFFLADHLYRYQRRRGPYWAYERHSQQDFGQGAGRFLTALAFAPTESRRAYALNDEGRLWLSADHGRTWEAGDLHAGPYFRPTVVAVDPHDALRAVVGGSGYSTAAVHLTLDGGRTWNPLADGMPSTLVYDLAFAAGDSSDVYAAAEAGAFRYSSQGERWENIMGLAAPATTYWSVEVVPATGGVRFGTYGRGIWDFDPARAEPR